MPPPSLKAGWSSLLRMSGLSWNSSRSWKSAGSELSGCLKSSARRSALILPIIRGSTAALFAGLDDVAELLVEAGELGPFFGRRGREQLGAVPGLGAGDKVGGGLDLLAVGVEEGAVADEGDRL